MVKNSFFCDASFLIAIFCTKDSLHIKSINILNRLKEKNPVFYVSWFIVGETLTILRYHYGYSFAEKFSQALNIFNIICPTTMENEKAIVIFNKFGRDKKVSFTDALSYVLIKERLNNIPALSFDKHFKSLGLTVI